MGDVAQEVRAPKPNGNVGMSLPGGDRLIVSQKMAVGALVNMTYGEPAECQRVACQSLVKALKSGSPAKKLACAQVLQHTLAHQSGRVILHGMQVIPALVALCSTGVTSANAELQSVFIGERSTAWATLEYHIEVCCEYNQGQTV